MSLKTIFGDSPTLAKQVLTDKDFWGRISITIAFFLSLVNAFSPDVLTGWLVFGFLAAGVWLVHD